MAIESQFGTLFCNLPIDFRFACFIIGGVSSTWAGIYFRKQLEDDSTKYFFASFISQSPSLIPQNILNAIFDVDIDFIQHSMHIFGLFRIWQRSRHFSSVSLNQKEFSKASRKVTRGIFMQTDSWAHQGVHPHKDSFTFFSSLYDRAVCIRKIITVLKFDVPGSFPENHRKFPGSSPSKN